MKVAFDSSAFVKRYIEASGSEQVATILQQTTALGLCVIVIPEIISALNRLQRETAITVEQYRLIKAALQADVADAVLLNVTAPVLAESVTLLENNALRGMDALHVAAAVVWQADLFVSADGRQLAAAQQAGLTVAAIT